LGLALTKFFVDQLNGTITVISRKNSGTIITVKIPYLESKDSGKKLPEPIRVKSEQSPTNSELTALIVDDNPLNKKVMQGLLDRVGFTCWTVNSGEEAIEFFEKKTGKPDVVRN
jgi:hypothetical protein